MLKPILLSLAMLASIPAVAEPVVVPAEAFTIPQVAAALEKKCDPDCIVMSREDWMVLMEKFKAAVKEEAKKNI